MGRQDFQNRIETELGLFARPNPPNRQARERVRQQMCDMKLRGVRRIVTKDDPADRWH